MAREITLVEDASLGTPMVDATLKQRVIEVMEQLPPDATVEDLMERLFFLAKVDRGLADADAGRVVPHEDVTKRFSA
jgi:predicted transcriptional regulator